MWGFAPRTTDAPNGLDEDRYDIVVTTDVLAEGVNLQQARHIINYDLPSCLDRARPPAGFDTPRVLNDDTSRRAFDAWEIARSDIVERWNLLADPANLQPKVPPALRRAADTLRSHPPSELTQDEIDQMIDAVCAPYPERIIRTIRAAMDTDVPTDQARNVLGVVRDLGLEPYRPPQPLPEITPDDVHLVCWLALV